MVGLIMTEFSMGGTPNKLLCLKWFVDDGECTRTVRILWTFANVNGNIKMDRALQSEFILRWK